MASEETQGKAGGPRDARHEHPQGDGELPSADFFAGPRAFAPFGNGNPAIILSFRRIRHIRDQERRLRRE
jgi:hypothetical protein